MSEPIHEPIRVVAVFDTALKPARFKWKGRTYDVREVTYQWTTREGNASVVHFSVTDGAALYELAYNQSTMRWSLEGIEA